MEELPQLPTASEDCLTAKNAWLSVGAFFLAILLLGIAEAFPAFSNLVKQNHILEENLSFLPFILAVTVCLVLCKKKAPAWSCSQILDMDRPCAPAGLGSFIFKAICLVFLCNIISTLLMPYLVNIAQEDMPKQTILDNIVEHKADSLEAFSTLFSTIILAPVMEEIVFRRILPRLFPFLGKYVNIVLCSIIFAAVHFLIDAAPALFLLSLLLFRARRLYGLRGSILLHASWNALSSTLAILGAMADS